jgi:hypothetical protein
MTDSGDKADCAKSPKMTTKKLWETTVIFVLYQHWEISLLLLSGQASRDIGKWNQ